MIKISRNPDLSCISSKTRQQKQVRYIWYLGSAVTMNVNIQDEINERIEKHHDFIIL